MKAFSVNIIGLSSKRHEFDFVINDAFFSHYGSVLIEKGLLRADVILDKHETFIEADFVIKGTVELTCDRSLDLFDYPIDTHHKIVFKFGDRNEEITDEIVMIDRDTVSLELGQYIYELINVAIPMKKLHPRFSEEEDDLDEDAEGKIIYTSGEAGDDDDDEAIDPRWEILKKLK